MSYVTEHTNTNETRTQSFEILIAKARPEETSLRAVTEATEPETVAATLRRRLFTNIKGNRREILCKRGENGVTEKYVCRSDEKKRTSTDTI